VVSIERAQARSRASVEAPFIASIKDRARESAAAIRAKKPVLASTDETRCR
jgi:hypothetical protein